ncbi:unnamed protein product [Leptidea sinapis]|uniref:Uncharacterized protein n=1 Tax=Leptidea sinapis TaxID=189913 RepID=A0A5E4QVZ3_9NEOP|nr:unnamed protein product [Leptidea sinapis]
MTSYCSVCQATLHRLYNRLTGPGPSSSTINREPESVEVITPSKYLNECSHIPKIPVPLYKRGKQGAAVLNSEEHINSKKAKLKGKAKKQTPDKPRKNNQKSVPKKKRPRFSSESEQEGLASLFDVNYNNIHQHGDLGYRVQ